MKISLLIVAAAAIFALPPSASAADKTARLPIGEALKIAQAYLDQRSASADHQITSITLEAATASATYWYARWSPAIPEGQKKQLGLRIDMDGSTTVFVTGSSAATGNTAGFDTPAGQRPVGARSIR